MLYAQLPIFTFLYFLFFLLHHSTLIFAANSPNPNSVFDSDNTAFHSNPNSGSSISWPWKLVLAFGRINTIATVIIILMTSLNVVVYKLRQIQEANLYKRLNDLSLLPSEKICRRFSLDDILSATNGFDEAFVIGRGGFGKVYKGFIDNGTVTVAMKRLDPMSKQGPHEFSTEINLLSQFRHSHVISLIGYCRSSDEMILVYEYMVRGSLADHLYKRSGKNSNSTSLSWVERIKICIGAARGLDYLHTGTGVKSRVIQRDVKSANILLDENWTAKISDFGLAKIGPANQSCTHVSTNVKGTFGYLDPEYFLTNRLTRKSDVYAFGVVLLEVLCGRRAVDSKLNYEQRGLAVWAQNCIKEGLVDQIVDPCLRGQILPDSMKVFVEIAGQCLQSHPKKRPTMAEVVAALESTLALQLKTDSSVLEWDIFNSGPFGNEGSVGSSAEQEEGINAGNAGDQNIQLSEASSEQSRVKTNKITAFSRLVLSLFGTDRVTSVNSAAKLSKNSKTNTGSDHQVPPNFKLFTYTELKTATRNFSANFQLGEGSSLSDFIGWIDEKSYELSKVGVGMAVAIKKFDLEGFEEFIGWQPEVKFLGTFSHPNFVSVIGCCFKHKEVFLVYEYLQNRSLERFLFEKDSKPLPWDTRLKIATGAARGLAFLHTTEKQIIYHSFRTSDILLDGDFNAKLSNFEQTKLGPINSYAYIESYNPTSVIEDMENHAYVAPECLTNGHLSEKSDVYRFGVVLLEIMAGRWATNAIRPGIEEISLNWVRNQFERKLKKAMDPRLRDDYPLEGAFQFALLVQKCLEISPQWRPSMKEVLETLEDINTVKITKVE
ncbi:hypothetical protein LguiA_030828 [Lonicera macranthoides]